LHVIAKKVDDLVKGQAIKKPAKAKPATKKKGTTPSKKSAKKAKPQGIKHMPATDKVLEAIKRSGDGINNAMISKETGLNQKQVSSALNEVEKVWQNQISQTGNPHGSLIQTSLCPRDHLR
jgi:hypothetical protein